MGVKKAALRQLFPRTQLFIHYVHGYFEAEAHFSSSWFSPHDLSPYQSTSIELMCLYDYHYTRWFYGRPAGNMECRLVIFMMHAS